MRVRAPGALLVFCAGAICARVQAQDSPVRRGSVQIAGTAHLYHTRDIGSDDGWTSLPINPRLGYFVVRGLALSGNVSFERGWNESSHSTSWGAGPGLTYFVGTGSAHWYPFVSGRTLFVRRRTGIVAPGHATSDVISSRTWALSAGLLFMLARPVGPTGEVFYQRDQIRHTVDGHSGGSNRGESYGVQWGIAAFVF